MKSFLTIVLQALALLFVSAASPVTVAQEAEGLRPFVLAERKSGSLPEVVMEAKEALAGQGFEVVGEYAPYENAYVLVVTSRDLKRSALRSELGGFGSVQRVTATVVDDQVQLAYTNPRYMANAYRMDGEMPDVAERLERALGAQEHFGARGRSASELRRYHYKAFMPYFDEPWKLGSFASHREAVKAIERSLEQGVAGTSKVYRVDLPGKQTLFGVGLTEGCGGDAFIMDTINAKEALKSTPHLPYEMLVVDGEVLALHAKFRIAQSFPDLSMLGAGGFWQIKCAPDSIRSTLRSLTGQTQVSEN